MEALVYPENFGKRMSIDETTLSQGELYTVITNKEAQGKKGCLAAIIKGTDGESIKKALNQVPVAVRYRVKEITMDLANSMDWIARTYFPNAIHTADRFHFQQVVSEAVQEMRIELRREAIKEEQQKMIESKETKRQYQAKTFENDETKKQLLARGRYLLFKPQSKWTDDQKKRSTILFREFPQLKKAYHFSMSFRNIFETKHTRTAGKKALHEWYEKVSIPAIETFISAALTIQQHEGKILNYFLNRETNASAESFNAKLKNFRALLRGVRDINFFLFRISTLYA